MRRRRRVHARDAHHQPLLIMAPATSELQALVNSETSGQMIAIVLEQALILVGLATGGHLQRANARRHGMQAGALAVVSAPRADV